MTTDNSTLIHHTIGDVLYRLSSVYANIEKWQESLQYAQQAVKYNNNARYWLHIAQIAAAPITGILSNGPEQNAGIMLHALNESLTLQPDNIQTLWSYYYAKLTHADWNSLSIIRQQVYQTVENMIAGNNIHRLLSLRKSK